MYHSENKHALTASTWVEHKLTDYQSTMTDFTVKQLGSSPRGTREVADFIYRKPVLYKCISQGLLQVVAHGIAVAIVLSVEKQPLPV